MHMMANSAKLYLMAAFVIFASSPAMLTDAAAIAIDWGETIFATTPPAVLAATRRFGLAPICCAVVACRAAKRVLLLTTEPVTNTPIQPMTGERKGNMNPVFATANAMDELMPPKFITLATAITKQIMTTGFHSCKIAPLNSSPAYFHEMLETTTVSKTASKIAVPEAPIMDQV